jgi:8-oxo-dGTP pyrophosphatase MutT (NUDIX family)/NTP pyrophosphatase (non-canonical NTP hydrolase)
MSRGGRYAGVLLMNHEGAFLVTRHINRTEKVWRFPGGKIDSGESTMEAAARELKEELGIEAKQLIYVSTHVHQADGDEWAGYMYYCPSYSGVPTIQEPNKHADLSWVDVKQLEAWGQHPEADAANILLRDIHEQGMSVGALQQESWSMAEEKGFHGLERKAAEELAEELSKTDRAKWANIIAHAFASKLTMPLKLMLIVTEIAEAMEEVRAGHKPNEEYAGKNGKPEGAPAELADAVIRIADLCGIVGIDLEGAIRRKMDFNSGRPYLHGKTC